MITRENYEIYFIDFLEGNLSKDEMNRVENFLEKNADLKGEFELLNFDSISLTPSLSSQDFSFLKKDETISTENESDFFIGHLEGDLSQEEEKMLALYLKENPSRKVVFDSFQKIKLAPIIYSFPIKNKLKKRSNYTLFYTLIASSAAAILALFMFNLKPSSSIYQASNFKNNWQLSSPSISIRIEPTQLIVPEKTLANATPITISKPIIPVAIKPEHRDIKKLEIEKISSFEINPTTRKGLMANITPVAIPETKLISPTNNSYTPLEFAQEKTIDFVQEKTSEEVETGQDLFAFAADKVKENIIPKFVEIETQEIDKQQYRTISIGKKFSIKHKIKS